MDKFSAAEIDARVIDRAAAGTAGIEADDIAALERRNARNFGHGAVVALRGGGAFGADTGLAHAIIHKNGAVKALGRIGAGRIRLSCEILGDINRIFNALTFAHAGAVRGHRGLQRG